MPRQISRGEEALSLRSGSKVLVWDLPTRLFHWTVAALVGFSWWSAENRQMDWHIWSGWAILTLLMFRLLWGFAGSSTSRFSSFVRGPREIREYLRGQWGGIGHNPLGALSVIALLGSLAVQVALGLIAQDEDGIYAGPLYRLVSSDTSDRARDLHESWFNVLLALVALHVAAIIWYRIRGRAQTWPMITGRAPIDSAEAPMRPAKWWVALICLTAAIAITRWVIAGAPPFGP